MGVARPFYLVKMFHGESQARADEMSDWINDQQRSGYDLTSVSIGGTATTITIVVMNVRPRKKSDSSEDNES